MFLDSQNHVVRFLAQRLAKNRRKTEVPYVGTARPRPKGGRDERLKKRCRLRSLVISVFDDAGPLY